MVLTGALLTNMVKPAPTVGFPLTELSPIYLELKHEAFGILDNKCNVCHRKRNRSMVFSLDNMDKRAKKIHKQVFVKKRMPKGKDITLTEEEYRTLRKWLITQSIY